MLVDPENPRDGHERANPVATVIALEADNTGHLAMDARLNCDLCDDDGYRGMHVCDHKRRENVGRVQREHIRKMLAKGGKK